MLSVDTRVATGPARVLTRPGRRVLTFDHGAAAEIVTSYDLGPHGVLHSLAQPVTLDCQVCRHRHEVTLIGLIGDEVRCPSCVGADTARADLPKPAAA